MTKPLTCSHRGKLVLLHEDGRKTNPDGSPVIDPIEKPARAKFERWHDPYR